MARIRHFRHFIFFGAFAVLTLTMATSYFAYHHVFKPGPLGETSEIWIKKGQGLSSVAAELSRQQVIDNIFAFKLTVSVRRVKLKAGEYEIPARSSIADIVDILEKGKPVLRKLTIPEGFTSAEIYALLESSPYLTGEMPAKAASEGSLLPETYFFERGEERTVLLSRMAQAMKEKTELLWKERNPSLPLKDLNEFITLASIVEKETSLESERARIAGVFYNRLKRGMKLQTDPTIIFALTDGKIKLNRPLSRDDLSLAHPYNTYLYAGLPPGPIANPGEASLRAALNPLKTKDLYFVADGNGGHAFAETLEEHNRNVAKWRKAQKSQTP